jgi:hypothetical protein
MQMRMHMLAGMFLFAVSERLLQWHIKWPRCICVQLLTHLLPVQRPPPSHILQLERSGRYNPDTHELRPVSEVHAPRQTSRFGSAASEAAVGAEGLESAKVTSAKVGTSVASPRRGFLARTARGIDTPHFSPRGA